MSRTPLKLRPYGGIEMNVLLLWPPCRIGQAIIFLPRGFFLLSFFFCPRLISAASDWMSTILYKWCGLSANLECRSVCCARLAGNAARKKSPTIAQQQLKLATVATIDMGRKDGGLLCPFRAELSHRLIQCGLGRLPRFTSVPSGVFIHRAVWPQ